MIITVIHLSMINRIIKMNSDDHYNSSQQKSAEIMKIITSPADKVHYSDDTYTKVSTLT
jgi:hypothetical protein